MWVIFALLDPLARLNTDPIRIRIRNPGCKDDVCILGPGQSTNAGKASAKAGAYGGSELGSMIGGAVGPPVIGNIIGNLVGERIGEAAIRETGKNLEKSVMWRSEPKAR